MGMKPRRKWKRGLIWVCRGCGEVMDNAQAAVAKFQGCENCKGMIIVLAEHRIVK